MHTEKEKALKRRAVQAKEQYSHRHVAMNKFTKDINAVRTVKSPMGVLGELFRPISVLELSKFLKENPQ